MAVQPVKVTRQLMKTIVWDRITSHELHKALEYLSITAGVQLHVRSAGWWKTAVELHSSHRVTKLSLKQTIRDVMRNTNTILFAKLEIAGDYSIMFIHPLASFFCGCNCMKEKEVMKLTAGERPHLYIKRGRVISDVNVEWYYPIIRNIIRHLFNWKIVNRRESWDRVWWF